MKRKLKMIAALIIAVAIIATGTFAWQKAFEKRNEFMGHKKDVTVHDDFDPDAGLKDVYVENKGNTTVFVRIKLDETMNLTSDTWRPGPNDWVTHTYGTTATDCGHTNIADNKYFHNYFKWIMGGWKYYMPGNGPQSIIQDTNVYNGTEPGVQKTPDAKIITSAQFLGMSETEQKAFNGWIYSTDGYAYWSQPLKKGEATGLLLHGVEPLPILEDLDYYYAINVIVEVVDHKDIPMWTQGVPSSDGSGTTHQEASSDGKQVIIIIVGTEEAPEAPSVTLRNIPTTVKVGSTVNPPTVIVGPPGSPNSPLIWKSDNESIAKIGTDGKVTGIVAGAAIISVTAPNGLIAKYTIVVTSDTILATNVKINAGDQTIEVGKDYTPTITVTPPNSTDKPTWTSSNTDIATVDPETGKIIGIAVGETIVTVTVNGKTDSITVTVKDHDGGGGNDELPVNKPDNGFTPIIVPDHRIGDGYYAKINFLEYDNKDPNFNLLYHTGSVHLEDIITDENYNNVAAEAVDAKYAPYITIGACARHENKPSIIFSYEPTNDEFIQMQLNGGINVSKIPVQVKLTRDDGKTAVITINMVYNGSLVTMDTSHMDLG